MGEVASETKVLEVIFDNGLGEDKKRYLTDTITKDYIYYTDSFIGDQKRLNILEKRVELLLRNGQWKASKDTVKEFSVLD